MKVVKLFLTIFLILTFVIISAALTTGANDTMTVEANIIASGNAEEVVSIEVPNLIFLGNVSNGDSSDKFKIDVNNTGTVAVQVSPKLKDLSENIFSNLYFQNRKTGNNSEVKKLGDYSFDIDKPGASGKRVEYFWMWLDLSNFNGAIEQDMMHHKTDIVFVATQKV